MADYYFLVEYKQNIGQVIHLFTDHRPRKIEPLLNKHRFNGNSWLNQGGCWRMLVRVSHAGMEWKGLFD